MEVDKKRKIRCLRAKKLYDAYSNFGEFGEDRDNKVSTQKAHKRVEEIKSFCEHFEKKRVEYVQASNDAEGQGNVTMIRMRTHLCELQRYYEKWLRGDKIRLNVSIKSIIY